MPLADIGVNLADKRFSDDRPEVLDRARRAGVELMVLTGTDLQSSHDALALADPQQGLYATAGVHPHQASEWQASTAKELAELAAQPAVRCIGETGLDFNRDFSPRPAQEQAFAEQLQLAASLHMPVFLHQRDAHERFLAILREHRDALPQVVVHCFTDNRKALYDYLDLGCFIGITGWVCDERRGAELRTLVPDIPAQQLLLETDAPYLLPRDLVEKPPVKGRNEPALLAWIAQRVAQLRHEPVESLQASVWRNTHTWLGLELA
jgi:TatD DNase family protein